MLIIPIKSNDDAAEEMNRFLRGHHRLFPAKRYLNLIVTRIGKA